MFPASALALSIALFTANSREQLIDRGGSPDAENQNHTGLQVSIYSCTTEVLSLPFEPRTPTGLGAFFNSSTLKSMGMSFEEGGLYSCGCVIKVIHSDFIMSKQ